MAYSEGASASTAPKVTTVQSALEDFDPALGRLEGLVVRAMNCGDKIVGSRPSEVADNNKGIGPSNLIHGLQSRRERLVSAINHLESEVQRIEAGLA